MLAVLPNIFISNRHVFYAVKQLLNFRVPIDLIQILALSYSTDFCVVQFSKPYSGQGGSYSGGLSWAFHVFVPESERFSYNSLKSGSFS